MSVFIGPPLPQRVAKDETRTPYDHRMNGDQWFTFLGSISSCQSWSKFFICNNPDGVSVSYFKKGASVGKGGNGEVFVYETSNSPPHGFPRMVVVKETVCGFAERQGVELFMGAWTKDERVQKLILPVAVFTEKGNTYTVMPPYDTSLDRVIHTLGPGEQLGVLEHVIDQWMALWANGVFMADIKATNILIGFKPPTINKEGKKTPTAIAASLCDFECFLDVHKKHPPYATFPPPVYAYNSADYGNFDVDTPLTASSAVWAMGLILARAALNRKDDVTHFDKIFRFQKNDGHRFTAAYLLSKQKQFVQSHCYFKSTAIRESVMYALGNDTTMAGLLQRMNMPEPPPRNPIKSNYHGIMKDAASSDDDA